MTKIESRTFTQKDNMIIIGNNKEKNRSTDRKHKGKNANKYLNDYCVLDLETTYRYVTQADIIEIAVLKVRNNRIVDSYTTLINPQCSIPVEATHVNHITDEMVRNSPILEDVIDDLLIFVGEDVILGYNNSAFDMNLIYDNVQRLRGKFFSNDYIDIFHAVMRSLPDLDNYQLKTVSNYYGLDTTGAHRALKDCYLTKACYDKLFEEFGDVAFKKKNHDHSDKTQFTDETIALQEFYTLLEGMLCNEGITIEKISFLRSWLDKHHNLSCKYPFEIALDALDKVHKDDEITELDLDYLNTTFEEISNPFAAQEDHELINSLKEKHICLTGNFNLGDKELVKQLILSAGGIFDERVKRATNYLVVGAKGSDKWKTKKAGQKILKAMELKKDGYDIKILPEEYFIPALQKLKK